MYNRYIRNDRGAYTRITEDDGQDRRPQNVAPPGPPDLPPGPPPPDPPPRSPPPAYGPPPPPGPQIQDGLNGFLRHLLHVAHMEHVDTGDLLLLGLLFLLYREGADEELLVALGLLLIL